MSTFPEAFPTAAERAAAHQLLSNSRDQLVSFATGLGPQDWLTSASDGGWSVAGVLEHVAIIESRVPQIIETTLAQPVPMDWREQTAGQDARLPSVAIPTQKLEAPPPLHPTATREPQELLRAFTNDRDQTLVWVGREDLPLKQHLRLHPALGQLNLYQWLLAIGYHTQRHTLQMRRILESRASA